MAWWKYVRFFAMAALNYASVWSKVTVLMTPFVTAIVALVAGLPVWLVIVLMIVLAVFAVWLVDFITFAARKRKLRSAWPRASFLADLIAAHALKRRGLDGAITLGVRDVIDSVNEMVKMAGGHLDESHMIVEVQRLAQNGDISLSGVSIKTRRESVIDRSHWDHTRIDEITSFGNVRAQTVPQRYVPEDITRKMEWYENLRLGHADGRLVVASCWTKAKRGGKESSVHGGALA